MQKKLLLCLVLVGMLFVTACGKGESEVLTCTNTTNISEGINMSLNYKVTHRDGYVELIETKEELTADDEEYLETYAETVKGLYKAYDDIEYYDYDVKVEGNTLTSTTKIDYSKIDTDKLLEIDSANGALIKDGKIKLSDIQAAYESLGSTCK